MISWSHRETLEFSSFSLFFVDAEKRLFQIDLCTRKVAQMFSLGEFCTTFQQLNTHKNKL